MASTGGIVTILDNAKFEVGTALPAGGGGVRLLHRRRRPGGSRRQPAGEAGGGLQVHRLRHLAGDHHLLVAEHRLHAGPQVGHRQPGDAGLLRQESELQDRGRSAAEDAPQDSARVWIPNGDQIIGKGLEQILVNNQDAAVRIRRGGRDAHRRGATGHRGAQSHRLDLAHRDGEERGHSVSSPLPRTLKPLHWSGFSTRSLPYRPLSGTVLARERGQPHALQRACTQPAPRSRDAPGRARPDPRRAPRTLAQPRRGADELEAAASMRRYRIVRPDDR